MKFDPAQVEAAVRAVLSQIDSTTVDIASGDGVFTDMGEAIEASAKAQREYLSCSLADRRRYVEAIRSVMLKPENLDYMSTQAVIETGMGDVAHKYLKNKAAAEGTPGVEDLVTEAWSGDDGLTTLEYSPFGVIGAITPTTNPTETITCNGIGMLAAGNSVVFSPHPRAKNLSLWQIQLLNRTLAEVGAPANLITTVAEPTLETTNVMMSHPLVRLLVATGGPGIVKAVLQSGKKAIGAGAGNPPAVVDSNVDVEYAAKCIVDGASFDNNLPCTSEKEVIAVDSVAEMLKFCMIKHGAYEVTGEELKALEELITPEGKPNPKWIGKSAADILTGIGVEPPAGVRLVVCEAPLEHPFVQHELMMPVVGIVRAPDMDTAIEWAIEVEHGNRHTSIIHSRDVTKLTKMGKLIQTTIYVKNGPSFAGIGIGGEGFPTFTIAGPTGEGLTSPRSFTRRRRCVLVGDLSVR